MTRRTLSQLLGDDPPTPAPMKRGGQLQDHRQKLVREQAEHTRLKNQKMRGELVPAADVEAEWSSALADLRAALLAVPSRVGAKLALPRATVAAIDAEIRAALLALAASAGVEGDGDA